MKTFLSDLSFSSIVAGFISLLVGYTSSAVIVYQAAIISGAGPEEATSWLGVLCVSMGILTVVLSLRYKAPVMFAWSTAGGAILMGSVQGFTLNQIIGSFIVSAGLIFFSGVTGLFEKLMNKIPVGIASAMLAGVLLHFVLDVFTSIKTQNFLALSMLITYIFGKKFLPKFNIVFVLLVGVLVAYSLELISFLPFTLGILKPVFTTPEFSFSAVIALSVPLFFVTMSSQNLTGVAVMKAYNYKPQVSKLIGWSGLVNLLVAPFGGYSLNLSALTAAICMGPEAHFDPEKRYTAAVSSGLLYIIVGLFAGAVVTIFNSFPKELVMCLAGLALMSTVTNGLVVAIKDKENLEASMMTFFVTASGVVFLGVGSAFWGLVMGTLTSLIFNLGKKNEN